MGDFPATSKSQGRLTRSSEIAKNAVITFLQTFTTQELVETVFGKEFWR